MESRLGLYTQHVHEVVVWENKEGLQWDISSLPDGTFTRINYGKRLEEGREGRQLNATFWVDTATNVKWPVRREPAPEEVANFAILALSQMPDSKLTKSLAKDAVTWLKVRAQELERRSSIITKELETLGLATSEID